MAEPTESVVHRYRWEIGWVIWAIANICWMEAMQDWISIPFHFIWVSFTLLYGFRAWRNGLTWTLVGFVVVFTGVILLDAWTDGAMSADEVFEVPLMFGMFLAMMLHTTRRKAAIVELEKVSDQNARLLEREHLFVQNASHALRTPITVALAHAEMLQITTQDPAVTDDLGVVVDEIVRLRGLADRLLLLATAEAPAAPHLVPAQLGDLVRDVARRWSPIARCWSLGPVEDVTALVDAERLTLALDTLIDNAVNVTDDEGRIELSVRRDGASAVIEVADDGPGIPPDRLRSIFERFADVSDHGRSAGFGLGLAIVQAIAEAHGGSVSAGNHPSGGAVLTLRLPVAPASVGTAPAPPADRADTSACEPTSSR